MGFIVVIHRNCQVRVSLVVAAAYDILRFRAIFLEVFNAVISTLGPYSCLSLPL